MRDFELFIIDDRYSVATLRFATVRDEARARELAEGIVRESAHHVGVEVREADRLLFRVGRRDAAATPVPAPRPHA